MFPRGKITPQTQLRPDKGESPQHLVFRIQSYGPSTLCVLYPKWTQTDDKWAYVKFPSSVQEKNSDGISQARPHVGLTMCQALF